MAIIELIKNRKYKIVVPISYIGNKRHCVTRTFECGKKEAVLKENQIKMQIKNGTFIEKNNITVKEFFGEWIKYQEEKWAPKTYEANLHWCDIIIESIGHIKLKNINVKVLENFYSELRKCTKEIVNKVTKEKKIVSRFSDKTIQHFYTLISSALNKAVDWEYIEKNPNKKIEKPKVIPKEKDFYNIEEVNQLLKALEKESLKYQALIILALDTGARRGEITGLTWEDIDFDNATVNINKTTQYTRKLGIFEKSTKSPSSNRVVNITEKTLNILKKYKVEQLEKQIKLGDKWEGSKRVFTTELGGDMHPDTPSQVFEKIIKKHNLKRISFHEIRHTSITLLSSLGVPIVQTRRRAGHSSISITDKYYTHIPIEDRIRTAKKINTVLEMKAI